ncbi:MAG: ankyrin repeat domain-containing protein [Gammaproteobacteria bacterium]
MFRTKKPLLIQTIKNSINDTRDEVYAKLSAVFKQRSDIDENAADENGQTPLICAVKLGNIHAIEWLFDETQHRTRVFCQSQKPKIKVHLLDLIDRKNEDLRDFTQELRAQIQNGLAAHLHQQATQMESAAEQLRRTVEELQTKQKLTDSTSSHALISLVKRSNSPLTSIRKAAEVKDEKIVELRLA